MRTERDSLGEMELPDDALWGAQAQRAVLNFPISGTKPNPVFIKATVQIKKAAARVNEKLGILDAKKADAIVKAADEVLGGKWLEHFVVDVFQAGAGTSHNMNTNEVLANRACEILGGQRGDTKLISPNDDVNNAQSTNDVIPTAMRLGALEALRSFEPQLERLARAFELKAKEFDGIVKSGRTHLQDAVPMRLGQEFGGYASSLGRHQKLIKQASEELKSLGIGGSAAGTGLNVHPKYRQMMADTLSEQMGFDLRPADDFFEAMQSFAPFVAVSNAVENLALDVTRIANDIRLLSSGPMTGLFEIVLPTVQPGSSIMPGKINPSIVEMVNQVSYYVLGNAQCVRLCSQAGQLELNVMMPVTAFALIQMIQILGNALEVFAAKCVEGLTANAERCRDYAERSISVVTALNTYIGYLKAAEIAKQAVKEQRKITDIAMEQGLLSQDQLRDVLNLEAMTHVGIPGKEHAA